jgi:hypothetical protein
VDRPRSPPEADGSSQTNLTNNPANDFEPAWQPK